MFLRGNSMSARTDAFLAEIRAMPNFATAAATDSKWGDHLDNIEQRRSRPAPAGFTDGPVLHRQRAAVCGQISALK